MRVGVGLPTTTPGADGALLVEWARNADAGPFSSLGVLDRLLYDSFDPFASLAAAAAVTQRIRLATMIAIGPLRPAATLIEGRGVGAGALRRPAHARARHRGAQRRLRRGGVPTKGRGARLSDQLAELRDWDVSPVVPGAVKDRRPELLVGGNSGAAFARMARYGDGYAHGGGPPRAFASAAAKALAAWSDLGRPGKPALWGQAYFALGDEAAGEAYLLDYYAFTGPFAAKIAAGNLTSPRAHPRLRARLRGGRLRRARAAADRRRPRAARAAGRGPRVKTTVLGAGPSGLYLSILLKKADPRHEVVVVERNPPDATFGFGVVFSEETLGRLRDADEPTFTAITDAWASWTTIDVHFGGEVIRSHGHRFSAIRRTKLLAILQRRARELGVELRFEQEVRDLGELPEADLLVGADGVNSLRPARARSFGRSASRSTPRASPGSAPTSRSTRSPSRSWRRSTASSRRTPIRSTRARARSSSRRGRTRGGAPGSTRSPRRRASRSARSCSRPCSTATSCSPTAPSGWPSTSSAARDWSAGATVLVGDAAHTAHFSIGSGTKLAIEDAIELAAALGRHDEVKDALVEYELERRPDRRALPGGRAPERRVLRGGAAPLGAAAAAVRVQPAHAQRAHRPRQPVAARPGARPAGRRARRRPAGAGAAAAVRAAGAPRADAAQPCCGRRPRRPCRRGAVPVAGARGHARRPDHAR